MQLAKANTPNNAETLMTLRHAASLSFAGLGIFVVGSASNLASANSETVVPQTSRIPTLFFENHGQFDPLVEWASAKAGVATFYRSTSFAIRFNQALVNSAGESQFRGAALEYVFENASTEATIRGEDPRAGRIHFMVGDDPSEWKRHLETYGTIRYTGLYEGVEVTFREMSDVLEYDIVLAPGASLENLRIRCNGAESLSVDSNGSLIATTLWGNVVQKNPRSWQIGTDGVTRSIDSCFVLHDRNTYGFHAGSTDSTATTVIDPGITYSTFLGGVGGEHGCGVAVDDLCGVYVTGDTMSLDYPTTFGSFDVSKNANSDVFVTRMNANFTELIYSTFVGGSNADFGHGVAVSTGGHTSIVNGSGVAHVTGGTRSANFPVTPNAVDTSANGGSDAFLFALSANGAQMLYSTFIGGSADDGALGGQSIALDPAGGIYVTGYTHSSNFPISIAAADVSHNGLADMFACHFTPDATSLVYSSFCGGSATDVGVVIDVDALGVAYIGSTSDSADFPTTVGAYSSSALVGSHGVVTMLSADGATVVYSSFTGGTHDAVRGISVHNGECFVAGYTLANTFQTTPGAAQPGPGANGDGFVLKLDSTGTSAIFATLLGGSASDGINDLDTDALGHAYVSGWTDSTDFPVTPGLAYDSTHNGMRDTFCTRLAADGSQFDYSTYLGGAGDDASYAIDVHDIATLYVVGGTTSADFPTTAGVFDESYNGAGDVFVTLLPSAPTTCSALAFTSNYGVGEISSVGMVATLNATSLPTVPSSGLKFSISNVARNAPVFLLVGSAPTSVIFDSGTLLVAPKWIFPIGSTSALGALTMSIPVADNPNFCNDEIYLQAAVMDNHVASQYQVVLTNGVLVRFGS
jgi:Beta-propeller repeat